MDANRRSGRSRIRVYVFDRERPGVYVDRITLDVSVDSGNLRNRVAEIIENLPADNFAIVCDSVPYPAIKMGYEGKALELGEGKSQERESVDSSPQGLARNETSAEVDCGTGEREDSRTLDYEREYLRISTHFHP